MKRILFLATDVFARGGIPRYARYQIRALREIYGPANVYVLSLLAPQPAGFEEPFEVDGWGGQSLNVTTKLRFLCQALFWTKKANIDLIVCNHISLTPIALIAKKLFGTRYWMNAYGIEIWSGLRSREVSGMEHADHVLSDCRFTKNVLINDHGVLPTRISVLEDCVDVEKFKPRPVNDAVYSQYNIPRGPKIILTTGRLDRRERYKGHERVMQALKASAYDLDVVYVIVGDGDDRPRLEQLARQLGLGDRVRFTGFVPDELLVDFYNICDLFILVSEFSQGKGEGIPMVLLEASACGKPVIAGKYDGSAEAVEDEETGLVVDSLNLEEISTAICTILKDEVLARQMGEAGRARVVETFSFEVFRDRLARYLENPG